MPNRKPKTYNVHSQNSTFTALRRYVINRKQEKPEETRRNRRNQERPGETRRNRERN